MRSKRIGIITLQKSISSYGASLQAYATFMFLKSQGYDTRLIDLRSHENVFYIRSKQHLTISKSKRKSCIKGRLVYYLHNPKKILRFWNFNNLLKYTRPYYSVDQLFNAPPVFDIYCTGSDQTLNPRLTIAPDAYLLGFSDGKKISYASSLGEVLIEEKYTSYYKDNVPKYNHISVREEHTKQAIGSYYDVNEISVTLDPTLLLPISHYEDICKCPRKNDDYLLFFSLHPKKSNIHFAMNIAKSNKLRLIVIGHKIKGIDAEFIATAGPKEWLGYIKCAKHIITDSFHGTVFSLLLNDNFITLVPMQGDNRIGQLLSLFGLEVHMKHFEDGEVYSVDKTFFDKSNFLKKLDSEVQKSKDWFLNAIEN